MKHLRDLTAALLELPHFLVPTHGCIDFDDLDFGKPMASHYIKIIKTNSWDCDFWNLEILGIVNQCCLPWMFEPQLNQTCAF